MTTKQYSANLNEIDSVSRYATPGVALVVFVVLIGVSLAKGTFGDIGPDNDDQIRLLQIRDWLGGQSWFDLEQYRLGSNGTAMHWSRLVDLPIALLAGLFGYFTNPASALNLAVGVWPPLCAVLVVIGLMRGALFLQRGSGSGHSSPWIVVFCGLLIALHFARHGRFLPGAIDHHNVQLALLALAIGFAIDPEKRWWSGAVSGAAIALSVAVGVEVYLFAGVVCGWFVVWWLLAPMDRRSSTIGFGLGLAVTALAVFFATIAPQSYSAVACDAFSLITVSAAGLGGLGIAAVAVLASARSLTVRVGLIALLGLACIALLLSVAPQCLANPLSSLPIIMHELWLDHVGEAKSIFATPEIWSTRGAYLFGAPLLAIGVCIWQIARNSKRPAHTLFLALLVISTAMAAYQIRFGTLGLMFTILPLGNWVGELFTTKQTAEEGTAQRNSLIYILALTLSVPVVWSLPGRLLDQSSSNKSKAIEAQSAKWEKVCLNDEAVAKLKALRPGLILAHSNLTPSLLLKTKHRALNGNYHRNIAGIEASVRAFTARPAEALAVMKHAKVDYLLFCPAKKANRVYTDHSPDGLIGQLQREQVPDYLSEISAGDRGAKIFAIR